MSFTMPFNGDLSITNFATISNNSDILIYPEMLIKKYNDGDIVITNLNTGQIFKFTDLKNEELIYINNDNETITSDINVFNVVTGKSFTYCKPLTLEALPVFLDIIYLGLRSPFFDVKSHYFSSVKRTDKPMICPNAASIYTKIPPVIYVAHNSHYI